MIFNHTTPKVGISKAQHHGVSTNCRYGHHEKCSGRRREPHGLGLSPCTCQCHRKKLRDDKA
jgi:hypothetical protein